MTNELLQKIRETPILYSILREESYHYRYLYENQNYIYELEKRAKEKYKVTLTDKLERLEKQISFINTLISVIE